MAQLISLVKHSIGDHNFIEWFGLQADDPSMKITPVVWVEYRIEPEKGVYLYSIETRPGYRNRGYAKKVLELIKISRNVAEIFHNGSYTPEGFSYIYPNVTWVRDGFVEEPKVGFRSMNFVDNWDKYLNHLK